MKSYYVSLPANWQVEKDETLDRLSACNKPEGYCTGTGGGFPLTGAIAISLLPADYSTPRYSDISEIVARVPHAGSPAPIVTPIFLENGTPGLEKRCLVARSILLGKVWDEVYGVDLGGHLFRAWVQYNREPRREAEYRAAVIGILSSLTPLDKPEEGRPKHSH